MKDIPGSETTRAKVGKTLTASCIQDRREHSDDT